MFTRNEGIDIGHVLKGYNFKEAPAHLFKKLQIGVNNRTSNEQICQHV